MVVYMKPIQKIGISNIKLKCRVISHDNIGVLKTFCNDQGLGETLIQCENETPLFPSAKQHQQRSPFKGFIKNTYSTNRILSVWLRGEFIGTRGRCQA